MLIGLPWFKKKSTLSVVNTGPTWIFFLLFPLGRSATWHVAEMLPGASGLLREKADGHNMPSPSVTRGILKALLSQVGKRLAKCVLHWTKHNYPKYSK